MLTFMFLTVHSPFLNRIQWEIIQIWNHERVVIRSITKYFPIKCTFHSSDNLHISGDSVNACVSILMVLRMTYRIPQLANENTVYCHIISRNWLLFDQNSTFRRKTAVFERGDYSQKIIKLFAYPKPSSFWMTCMHQVICFITNPVTFVDFMDLKHVDACKNHFQSRAQGTHHVAHTLMIKLA